MVRTKRPQWHPLAWRSGATSGTETGVARISAIFIVINSPYHLTAASDPPRPRHRLEPRRQKMYEGPCPDVGAAQHGEERALDAARCQQAGAREPLHAEGAE